MQTTESSLSRLQAEGRRIVLLQIVSFFALGALNPFQSLYFRNVLTDERGRPAYYFIGLLFFIQAASGMLGTPIAGYLSDRFKIKNRILFFCSLMVTTAAVFQYLPGLPLNKGWSFQSKTVLFFIGMTLNGLFFRPIQPLIDTAILEHLHAVEGNGDRYGSIRLFGSLSWALAVCGFGYVLYTQERFDYLVLGYGLGYLVLALVASRGVKAKIRPVRIPWEHLRADATFRALLVFSFFYGTAVNSSFNFTSYLMEDLDAAYWQIGLAFGLAGLPEIPFMFHAGRIRKGIGERGMMLAGSFFMLAKLVLLVTMTRAKSTLFFILIQSMHGLGYALFILGAIYLMDRRAHEDLRAMYQNLFQLVWSMAMAAGGLLAGFIIQRFGNLRLMAVDAAIVTCSIPYLLIFVREREWKRVSLVE